MCKFANVKVVFLTARLGCVAYPPHPTPPSHANPHVDEEKLAKAVELLEYWTGDGIGGGGFDNKAKGRWAAEVVQDAAPGSATSLTDQYCGKTVKRAAFDLLAELRAEARAARAAEPVLAAG